MSPKIYNLSRFFDKSKTFCNKFAKHNSPGSSPRASNNQEDGDEDSQRPQVFFLSSFAFPNDKAADQNPNPETQLMTLRRVHG